MAYVLTDSQRQKKGATQVSNAAPTGGATAKGAASMNAAPQNFTKSNFSDTNAIINRNQNLNSTAIGDRVVKPAVQEAQSQSEAMQNKATNYVAQEQDKANQAWAQPGEDQIDAALSGDNNAYGNLSKYLQGQADTVSRLDLGHNNPIQAAQAVKQGDVSGVLGKTAQGDYTRGMGALDNIIFRKSGQYGNVAKNVNQLQTGVDDTRNSLKSVQDDAQNYANTLAKNNSSTLKSHLGGLQSGIKGTATSRLNDFMSQSNSALAAKQAETKQGLASRVNEIIQRIQDKDFDPNSPLAKAAVDYQNLNLDGFIQSQGQTADLSNFVGSDEASKFNKLSQLLGSSDVLNSAGPATQNFSVNPDSANFETTLGQILGKYVDPTNLYGGKQSYDYYLNGVTK